MSGSIQTRVLHDDHQEEVRVVELSASYEGMPGCYHSLARKLAVFESGEVILQWHGGINAPVDLRLTFAELDMLIDQFNVYCEDYDHTVPDEGVFRPASGFEALPD